MRNKVQWRNYLQVFVLIVQKDDAAGLAISEKMRGQIRGLDQASRIHKMEYL